MTSQSEQYFVSTQSLQNLHEEQLNSVVMLEELDIRDRTVHQIDQEADPQNIENILTDLETCSIGDSTLNEDGSIEHDSGSSFDEDFNESELTELLVADQQIDECFEKEQEVAECLAIDQDLTRCLASDEEMLALLETSERRDKAVDYENDNDETSDVEKLENISENVVDLFCNQRLAPVIYKDEENICGIQNTIISRAQSEPDLTVSTYNEVSDSTSDNLEDDNERSEILQSTYLEDYVTQDSKLSTHYLHCLAQYVILCEKCQQPIRCENCFCLDLQQRQKSLLENDASEINLSAADSFQEDVSQAVAKVYFECLFCGNKDQEMMLHDGVAASNEYSSDLDTT